LEVFICSPERNDYELIAKGSVYDLMKVARHDKATTLHDDKVAKYNTEGTRGIRWEILQQCQKLVHRHLASR
jgi:hypothetical protein